MPRMPATGRHSGHCRKVHDVRAYTVSGYFIVSAHEVRRTVRIREGLVNYSTLYYYTVRQEASDVARASHILQLWSVANIPKINGLSTSDLPVMLLVVVVPIKYRILQPPVMRAARATSA